jgi:ketosteroid isomerase-like protein
MEASELEQRLRTTFDRWNLGDRSVEEAWTDPDVEIVSASAELTGRSYRGYEGVRQWIADLSEAFDEWTLRLDEFEEYAPGHVLAVGAVHFRGRGSGATVDLPCGWIIDHDEGVLRRLVAFPGRVEEARAAARG